MSLVVLRQDKLTSSALGAILSYLEYLKIDQSLVPSCHFEEYNPAGSSQQLTLDGQALINLEILHNNVDQAETGSLFHFMNHCASRFGQRLLRSWICTPLQDPALINQRLDTVEWLASRPEVLSMYSFLFLLHRSDT